MVVYKRVRVRVFACKIQIHTAQIFLTSTSPERRHRPDRDEPQENKSGGRQASASPVAQPSRSPSPTRQRRGQEERGVREGGIRPFSKTLGGT
jgi:hypothetical protein